MEPYEGVDEETRTFYEPDWLGVGEGVEAGIGEVRVSPSGGGGGGGEGCWGNEGWNFELWYPWLGIITIVLKTELDQLVRTVKPGTALLSGSVLISKSEFWKPTSNRQNSPKTTKPDELMPIAPFFLKKKIKSTQTTSVWFLVILKRSFRTEN